MSDQSQGSPDDQPFVNDPFLPSVPPPPPSQRRHRFIPQPLSDDEGNPAQPPAQPPTTQAPTEASAQQAASGHPPTTTRFRSVSVQRPRMGTQASASGPLSSPGAKRARSASAERGTSASASGQASGRHMSTPEKEASLRDTIRQRASMVPRPRPPSPHVPVHTGPINWPEYPPPPPPLTLGKGTPREPFGYGMRLRGPGPHPPSPHRRAVLQPVLHRPAARPPPPPLEGHPPSPHRRAIRPGAPHPLAQSTRPPPPPPPLDVHPPPPPMVVVQPRTPQPVHPRPPPLQNFGTGNLMDIASVVLLPEQGVYGNCVVCQRTVWQTQLQGDDRFPRQLRVCGHLLHANCLEFIVNINQWLCPSCENYFLI